jgi:hypothetical protein
MTLASIEVFRARVRAVRETEAALAAAGSRGCEAFVLWSGTVSQHIFNVHTIHVPKQVAYKSEEGVCVRVDGDELHRLNRWLYDSGETLAVQIHTHPTDAYHSDTDDAFPIVTLLGGLSIVVPDFAAQGMETRGVAAYRLGVEGWRELSRRRTRKLLEYVEN